ncbi:MAG TPA: hypothetical protein VEP30_12290 [Chthoniobacterales bacterium]|nr:hypothetical protein [Chthoniobacterales bacterium]
MARGVYCLLVLVVAASGSLGADTDRPTASEIARLKSVCRELVGSQFPYGDLKWQRPWRRLIPYLRSKDEVYRDGLVCSGGCSGSISLRGGLWLDFTFINPQKFGERWGPSDGLLDSVTLSDGHRVLLHINRPNHALQPIAGRCDDQI